LKTIKKKNNNSNKVVLMPKLPENNNSNNNIVLMLKLPENLIYVGFQTSVTVRLGFVMETVLYKIDSCRCFTYQLAP